MKFTTKVPIAFLKPSIDYSSKIVSLGSCFAENMAEKFKYFKFQNAVNPFGIIFNPVSIEKSVNRMVNQIEFTEDDIFFHNDSWHSYEVHSEFSNPNKEDFLNELNLTIQKSNQQIIQATHIIITYGTSWVYRNKSANEIVANCHKVPHDQFEKEILSIKTIEKTIQNTIELIKKINPDCQFIYTISPVRHIKDGFAENTLSKAHLISGLQTFINRDVKMSLSECYFPSYEIMMDELRDYRFYAQDMLHPNQTAIDYIWERFSEHYICSNSFTTMQEVDTIQKGLAHRPFNPETSSHQQFQSHLNQKITKLTEQFPYMQFF